MELVHQTGSKKREMMEMKRYAEDIIDLHYWKYCQTTRSRIMPQLQMLLERILTFEPRTNIP